MHSDQFLDENIRQLLRKCRPKFTGFLGNFRKIPAELDESRNPRISLKFSFKFCKIILNWQNYGEWLKNLVTFPQTF